MYTFLRHLGRKKDRTLYSLDILSCKTSQVRELKKRKEEKM
jgi:hypothetical protein